MVGQPIANLQTAVTDFLNYFTPSESQDMMGLVTFSTAAHLKIPLETNFVSAVKAAVNSLTANGATNMEDAIAKAGAQLPIQTGTPNADWKQQYVVFFTDGEATAFTSTFTNGNRPSSYVVCTSTMGTNQWYDIYPYLADPNTGNFTDVNAVQTGSDRTSRPAW